MKKFSIMLCLVFFSKAGAQDVDSVMAQISETKEYRTEATFKSPHLVLLETNETQKAKNLAFWVGHRFGDIGGEFGSSHTLYGLDVAADLYLGFDYGVTDDLTIGVGRSKYDETYNSFLKYRILWQKQNIMPVSITLFGQSNWITREAFFNDEFSNNGDRMSYFFEAIIARKFGSGVSFLINPGYLLRPEAQVLDIDDNKNLFVIGFGARVKIFKRISLIADYTLVNGLSRPMDLETDYYNPLGIGIELETGGHVFSLTFQNSPNILANNFIANTTKSWNDGGVRFGFAISRNFNLGSKRFK